MGELQLRDPWFLLIAILCLPIAWLMLRSKSSVAISSVSSVNGLPKSLRARTTFVPAVLMCLSIVLAAIALARPQTPDATSKISREGIAIMMAIDRSSSMNARDLEEDFLNVNRLEVVKSVIHYFVTGKDKDQFSALLSTGNSTSNVKSGRPDDMIGVISFAKYADSICPLTLDHGNMLATVDEIELASGEENGTSIGEGLGLAVERLRQTEIESKIVILLTDGVSISGELPPMKAGDFAASENIKVYCIGAGTNGYASVPVPDGFGNISLRATKVEIDEQTLKAIAEKTGGRYFRATDKDSLKAIYEEIDKLERTEVSEFRFLNFEEHFHIFALLALIFATLSIVLQRSVFRTTND